MAISIDFNGAFGVKYFIFMVIFLAACSGAPEAHFRASFVGGCGADGSSKAICECIFDRLSDDYSDEDFAFMERHDVMPPDLMENMGKYTRECVSDVLKQLQ